MSIDTAERKNGACSVNPAFPFVHVATKNFRREAPDDS